MNNKIIAVSFDAMSPVLLEMQIKAGHLPNLARLMRKGAYGRLHKPEVLPHENSWSAFLTGTTPEHTGEWGHMSYAPDSYAFRELPAYDNKQARPFYCLDPKPRVAIFDVPTTRVEPSANGIQIFGWSVEANQFLRQSSPPELLTELTDNYGDHPAFAVLGTRVLNDPEGNPVSSFRMPNLYDLPALLALNTAMIDAMAQRTHIIRDLAAREDWDLLLSAYGEIHTVGHMLWHLGMPHPLHDAFQTQLDGAQPLQAALDALDREAGELEALTPEDGYLLIFSVSGMSPVNSDMVQMLFLPEFLYRWQTGQAALAAGDPNRPVPPPATHYHRHWKDEIWALRTAAGERDLISPAELESQNDPIDWNPTRWFQPLWPRMKAFALPNYYHGMVRLNVRGRDGQGVVEPDDYDRECRALADALLELTDARSGRPMVKEVTHTRRHALEDAPLAGPADLIVHWEAGPPVDTVQSPDIGRIGPVPYFRSGGHAPTGLCLICGPGIEPGSRLPDDAQVPDLTASVLKLMGRNIPAHIEGRPWW